VSKGWLRLKQNWNKRNHWALEDFGERNSPKVCPSDTPPYLFIYHAL